MFCVFNVATVIVFDVKKRENSNRLIAAPQKAYAPVCLMPGEGVSPNIWGQKPFNVVTMFVNTYLCGSGFPES